MFLAQAERLELVLGAGKQEDGKLLYLMITQKEKYEKWLFRVLVVLSELMVRPTVPATLPALILYCSAPVLVTLPSIPWYYRHDALLLQSSRVYFVANTPRDLPAHSF